MAVFVFISPKPAAPRSTRPASGIFEVGVEGGAFLATDDLELFHSFEGVRLVNGQPYTGPVRAPREAVASAL